VGFLDVPAASTFTVTWADGSTWTAPATERYALNNGVLTLFHVDSGGNKLAGARHYSPAAWTHVTDHRPVITPEPGEGLYFGGEPA
jgi:hypothetical protein